MQCNEKSVCKRKPPTCTRPGTPGAVEGFIKVSTPKMNGTECFLSVFLDRPKYQGGPGQDQ